MPDPIHPDRRDFLKAVAATAAGAALPLPAALADDDPAAEAKAFLDGYNAGWLPLETAANEASWVAKTDVSPAHTAEQVARAQPLDAFVGSPEVIKTVKRLLDRKDKLDDLTVRQLEKVRLRAAEAPGTRSRGWSRSPHQGRGRSVRRPGRVSSIWSTAPARPRRR